jgi:hypothetical protein
VKEIPVHKETFLSAAWLEMTRSFLKEAVGQLPQAARGVEYAYSASLTDPPAELDDGTGTVAYWFSIKVPDVELGSGERDDFGPVNRADYQAAAVHTREPMNFADPEFVARRQRGRQAELDAGKALPDEAPPELLGLLGDLHNFRAARTLDAV